MRDTFSQHSVKVLYQLADADAVAVLRAHRVDTQMALDFHGEVTAIEAVLDMPHWCGHDSCVEVVIRCDRDGPEARARIAAVIDAHVEAAYAALSSSVAP